MERRVPYQLCEEKILEDGWQENREGEKVRNLKLPTEAKEESIYFF